jgi:hypothetical protein
MSSKYRGFSENSDSGRNYFSGAWGSGELDGAALAKKYGLDTSEQGRGEGHIWGRNADGSEAYIGKSNMGLASNQDLISNHSKQANSSEIDHSLVPENLSSLGDIKGAILTEWSGGPAVEDAVEKKEPAIQYSPELGKALAYKETFEENLLGPGRVGEYLFARDDSVQNDFNDAYSLNLEKYRHPQTEGVLAEAQQKEDMLRAEQASRNTFDEDIYQPQVFNNQYKLSIADRLKRSDDRKFFA